MTTIAAPKHPHPSRAVARSLHGMVATPHAQATLAGLEVLRRGGNAIDAAIAANAVLCVVYPASCGIGGDAFWVLWDAKRNGLFSYNGSGRSAAKLDAAQLRERGETAVPLRGAIPVTVPGAVRSWNDVLSSHGSRSLDELLAPAERYAREGFAVTDVVANYFALNEEVLRQDAEATRVFLKRGVPRAGDVFVNPDLADTLAAIRANGVDAFYRGRVAEAIAKAVNAGGNPMTPDDIAAHVTEASTPSRLAWNGGELIAHPPNSQGTMAPIVMGMLANDRDADQALWNHLAIESVKIAYAKRDRYYGDPDFSNIPLATFLDPATLAADRARIDPDHAALRNSRDDHGDTIYLCVVDGEGNAVSLIESLYMNFGSGIVAPGTGVVLHNRGAYFRLDPGHPNELQGRKRPLHTLSPAMFLRDGKPEMVFGTMGGDSQPQVQIQFLHNYYDQKMNLQQAIDAPRWTYGRTVIEGRVVLNNRDVVSVESRFDPAVVASLKAKGHEVTTTGSHENAMGHGHAIFIDRERGTLAGAADPRADSAALGF